MKNYGGMCVLTTGGIVTSPLPVVKSSALIVCASNPSINFSDVHLYIENIDMSRNFTVDK